MLRRGIRIGLMAAGLGLPVCVPAVAATHYDAVKDFSARVNPAGPWTYRGAGNDGLYTTIVRNFDGAKDVDGWSDVDTGNGLAYVLENRSGSPIVVDGGALTLPTDHLIMDGEGEMVGADVQFLVPKTGTYKIVGDFIGLHTKEVKHFVNVFVNNDQNVELFQAILKESKKKFKLTVSLTAGETLDFTSERSGTSTKPLETGLAVQITGP